MKWKKGSRFDVIHCCREAWEPFLWSHRTKNISYCQFGWRRTRAKWHFCWKVQINQQIPAKAKNENKHFQQYSSRKATRTIYLHWLGSKFIVIGKKRSIERNKNKTEKTRNECWIEQLNRKRVCVVDEWQFWPSND